MGERSSLSNDICLMPVLLRRGATKAESHQSKNAIPGCRNSRDAMHTKYRSANTVPCRWSVQNSADARAQNKRIKP